MALLARKRDSRSGSRHQGGRSFTLSRMALTAAWVLLGLSVPALADAPTEYEVKAAFLFKFVSYVDWPQEAIDDAEYFEVGILGDNPFDEALAPIFTEKRAFDRPVRFRLDLTLEEAKECHLLFVANSEVRQAKAIAEALADVPVLTVGDAPDFADAGLIMAFEIVDSRVRFVINADAADESPLRVSSRLMEVARVVRPESKP